MNTYNSRNKLYANVPNDQTVGMHQFTQLENSFNVHIQNAMYGHVAERYTQDALFSFDDTQAQYGYRGSVATKISGITYRQLDYWARKHIVEPSIMQSHGSGTRRLYAFKDILILATAKCLLDAGVAHNAVMSAIGHMQDTATSQLSLIKLICDTHGVHECLTSEQILQYFSSGEALVSIDISSLYKRIKKALSSEQHIVIANKQHRLDNPLDRLRAERIQQRLLRHPMIREV